MFNQLGPNSYSGRQFVKKIQCYLNKKYVGYLDNTINS